MLNKNIVLCNGIRTPFGNFAGKLQDFNAIELMKTVIKEILVKTNIPKNIVDGVLLGWVGQGSHAPNIARICAIASGLDMKTNAFTIQQNCVSSIEAITSAARCILSGEGTFYIVGGTESMSNFPFILKDVRKKYKTINDLKEKWNVLLEDSDVRLVDSLLEGLTDPICKLLMAETAEKVAEEYNISKEEQDEYAVQSFKKAINAIENNLFKEYIVPVKDSEGNIVLDVDEYPLKRKRLVDRPEKMKIFKGLFRDKFKNSSVSIANSCPMSDGACGMIVTEESIAKDLGLDIQAKILGWGYAGVDPSVMGIAPVYATKKALENCKLDFKDIDVYEKHEAFAATSLAILKIAKEKFGWEFKEDKLNIHGGSLALGHPLAATGTRIVLSLIQALKEEKDARIGLATACAAGGIGGSIIISKDI